MFEIKETTKKTSELIQECRDKFTVWCYLKDKELDKQFPPPKKLTTRYFKKVVEADEELKNLSADDLKEKGIEGITLRERLLLELQYVAETGKHLDLTNWTLCSGSRYSDGVVPDVSWGGGKLNVNWNNSSNRNDYLRSRAVSLKPSSFNPSDLEIRVKNLEEFEKKVRAMLVVE